MNGAGTILTVLAALSAMSGVAWPAAASAATVSVEPFRWDRSFGSCGRYMNCPANMVVFTAASGEINRVSITETVVGFEQTRFIVRDYTEGPVVAGAGCERVVDESPFAAAVVCTAEALGPQQLGDGDDRITSPGGLVSGGDGDDVMMVNFGVADGGGGDDVVLAPRGTGGEGGDVLIGTWGVGGSGDDLVMGSGRGGPGDDTMRCLPQDVSCSLVGGPGHDVVTGGTHSDRLFGEGGHDLLDGGVRHDELDGGPGNDRVIGGRGRDTLEGGAGADKLEAREDPSAGEEPKFDRVDCGKGRRDRATVDHRDAVRRCERVARSRE
jgi:RTX calcium-binding nonapeptide repeat (4 copies)